MGPELKQDCKVYDSDVQFLCVVKNDKGEEVHRTQSYGKTRAFEDAWNWIDKETKFLEQVKHRGYINQVDDFHIELRVLETIERQATYDEECAD